MPIPTCLDWSAVNAALMSLGFDGRPAVRSIRFDVGTCPDDGGVAGHAVEVVTADGETHLLPLVLLQNGRTHSHAEVAVAR